MAKPLDSYPRMTGRARRLRRHQTDAESKIWRALRSRQFGGVKFRRQLQIGPYIADFVSHDLRLVIEIDGGQHTPEKDAERTAFLERAGYHVVRFWNNEVLQNTEAVLETLLKEIETLS